METEGSKEDGSEEAVTVSAMLKGTALDGAVLRLWRIATEEALARPGSADARLLAEIVEKLLEPAERIVRVAELLAPVDVITLRGIVANWKGSEEVVIINPLDLQRQLAVALEALGAALGIEEIVRETGETLERIAMEAS